MNPNMSIYRRLNLRLLVQVGLGLGLLHWANICLIYISNKQKNNTIYTYGDVNLQKEKKNTLIKILK